MPLPRSIPNVSNNSQLISLRGKKNPDYDTLDPYRKYHMCNKLYHPLLLIMKVKSPEYSHTSESSFSQMGSGIGTIGLRNLGNTCFMKFNSPMFKRYFTICKVFLDGSFKRHINRNNPLGAKGEELADKFATLIRVMWSDQYVSVSPVTFKEAIGCFAPQLNNKILKNF
ncbi:cysteine proteinase [Gigaspora margarita]|uniref:Cysteine proteinase n=1 Tax=Gigaspora margarita TaxID=4874 RepID=A0A8H4ASI3_GIGMA|nr:cysteine proteinase [Gigaspora margarita]